MATTATASNNSNSTTTIKILHCKFVLEEGTEEDRDYILGMVQRGLDSHAIATTHKTEYYHVQTGQTKVRYGIQVRYTHHFNTRHDSRVRKIMFKLRLKYPDIKLVA